MSQLLEKMKSIDYIYESVNNLYSNKKMYVYLKQGVWTLLADDGKTELYKESDAGQILNILSSNQFDLGELELYVSQIILNSATLARKNIKTALKFFSEGDIDKQEEHWENFAKSMGEALKDITKKQNRKLKVL